MNVASMYSDRHIFPFFGLFAILLMAVVSCTSKETSRVFSYPYLLVINTRAVSFYGQKILTYTYDYESGFLDAFGASDKSECILASTSGKKTVVAIAGIKENELNYRDVLSLDNFAEVRHSIYKDDPGNPVASGMTVFEAGPTQKHNIDLLPLMARIHIRSLVTDFSSRPYSAEKLTDVRIYLINASGSCPLIASGDDRAREYVNQAGLNPRDMEMMTHPEMLLASGIEGTSLYCYPNNADEGGLGVYPTRLVIEGKVAGVKYYWPIRIGEGVVERGHQYVYDIRITRTGMLEPDTDAANCLSYTVFDIEEWREKDNEIIDF